jgi:hypothetical protein
VEIGERSCNEQVHSAQQVLLWDAIFETKLIEQPALIPSPPPHHLSILRP